MNRIRRILAALLVVLTVLSCNVTGFAATKPSAKLVSYTKTVKRGKTAKFSFDVKTGSYTQTKNKWRSALDYRIYFKKTNAYATSGTYFYSCDDSYNYEWKVPKKTKKGEYVLAYRSIYSSKGFDGYDVLDFVNGHGAKHIKATRIKTATFKVK